MNKQSFISQDTTKVYQRYLLESDSKQKNLVAINKYETPPEDIFFNSKSHLSKSNPGML